MSRENSNIMLTVVDLGDASDGMLWAGKRVGDDYYVTCSEGVSYNLTKRNDDSPESFVQEWAHSYVDMQLIIDSPGEQIDLARLVREFGSRLEVNFILASRLYSV